MVSKLITETDRQTDRQTVQDAFQSSLSDVQMSLTPLSVSPLVHLIFQSSIVSPVNSTFKRSIIRSVNQSVSQ